MVRRSDKEAACSERSDVVMGRLPRAARVNEQGARRAAYEQLDVMRR